MSVTFLDRHRLLRGFLCLLLCVVMVVVPLTTVKAIAVETAAVVSYVLITVINSLGLSLVTDLDGTTAMVNQIFSDLSDTTKIAVTNLATAALGNWDHVDLYAEIAIDYGTFTAISFEVTEWFYRHGLLKGDEPYPDDVAPVITYDQVDMFNFESAKSVKFATRQAMFDWYNSRPSRDAVIAKLGNSIVYRGSAHKSFPMLSSPTGSTTYAAVVANCKEFKGNGSHVSIREVDHWGLTLPSSCTFCERYYDANEAIAYLAYIESERRYYLNVGRLNSQDVLDAGYESYPFTRGYLGILPFSMLDIPVAGIGGNSVSVPLERDKDYAPGVVTGLWEDLIGKLGDFANSLPFNIPMTGDAAMSATPSIVLPKDLVQDDAPSVDIPDDPAIDLPEVGALTLPKSIINKFPFCIPFDLAKGLELLSAPPIEPRFVIPFKYGDVVNEEIVLDFSDFDYVVRMIRWFEVLLFTMGLAVATRQFIKW